MIKVKKIIRKKDYHTKCSLCNRKLKKALITNEGPMGYRCYLSAIGMPTNKQRLSIKDFPNKVFNDIWVAKKVKEGRRVVVEYVDFRGRWGRGL